MITIVREDCSLNVLSVCKATIILNNWFLVFVLCCFLCCFVIEWFTINFWIHSIDVYYICYKTSFGVNLYYIFCEWTYRIWFSISAYRKAENFISLYGDIFCGRSFLAFYSLVRLRNVFFNEITLQMSRTYFWSVMGTFFSISGNNFPKLLSMG